MVSINKSEIQSATRRLESGAQGKRVSQQHYRTNNILRHLKAATRSGAKTASLK